MLFQKVSEIKTRKHKDRSAHVEQREQKIKNQVVKKLKAFLLRVDFCH